MFLKTENVTLPSGNWTLDPHPSKHRLKPHTRNVSLSLFIVPISHE